MFRRILVPLSLVLAFTLTASTSTAALMTLTFDTGAYDPNISGGPHGPYDWIESGARIAGFWAVDVGTLGATWEQGHTHLSSSRQPGGRSQVEAMHSWQNDLQGIEITLESGAQFDLISLDYKVVELDRPNHRHYGRLPWSYAVETPKIITTDSFDPTLTDFEGQWDAWEAAPSGPWRTLQFTGMSDLTNLMISQTAHSILIDNIVIDVEGASTPIPEPDTAVLLGLGLVGLAQRRTS